MADGDSYGAVYTPRELSDFVSRLAVDEYRQSGLPLENIVAMDPACGEGVLLCSLRNLLSDGKGTLYAGIDIDARAIEANKKNMPSQAYTFIEQNTILPAAGKTAHAYWKSKFKCISIIIANPPWSSEKIFDRNALDAAGYCFDTGQYDSYVLFLELCLKIVRKNGIVAFIVPDSLFSGENGNLRKYLCEHTEIKVVARLGERIFPNINRSTSVLILKKNKPSKTACTKCCRLDTDDRRRFINGELELLEAFQSKQHTILQRRFLQNNNYVFDVDALQEEEALLNKIEGNKLEWEHIFRFGRGVELSKSGDIVLCGQCGKAHGYTKRQVSGGRKICRYCGADILFEEAGLDRIVSGDRLQGYMPMYVGENIKRYAFSGIKYIRPGVDGIRYKQDSLYTPPKLLIRKTGLGIYACIDYSGAYTSQTVYSCSLKGGASSVPLEYYLGVLNSRLLYYYYLKKYGENEWKSHPYLTKEIIFSLPIRRACAENLSLCLEIARCAGRIQDGYTREGDIELEWLVMQLYGITETDLQHIRLALNRLPDLGAVNQMKLLDGELCFDI